FLACSYLLRVAIPAGLLLLLWRGSWRVRYWVLWIVLTYLPFTGFKGGWAGPYRYFYLPAVGYSALLAMGLWRLRAALGRRISWTAANAATVVLIVLWFAVWAAPSRVWENRMVDNGQVRRAVIDEVRRVQSENPGLTAVHLAGFPVRFADLGRAVPKMTGVETTRGNDPSVAAPHALVIEYGKFY
ncbi:hypothetical protein ACFLT5_04080, partial [Chloroflexota bacterium]